MRARRAAFVAAVVLVLVLGLVPTQQAVAFDWTLPVMFLARLIDREVTRPEEVSDEALCLTAHILLDGQEIASSFTAQGTAAVIGKMPGHDIEYVIDPALMMRPHLDRGISRVRVSGNTTESVEWSREDAERCYAGTSRRPFRGQERDRDEEKPTRWLIPIDVSRLAEGAHMINVDVYFRNGKKDSSLRGLIYLRVTSYEELKQGVNSEVVQEFLRSLNPELWSPVPALGTTSVPVDESMARQLGLTDRAQASGVPATGTVEVREEVKRETVVPAGPNPRPQPQPSSGGLQMRSLPPSSSEDPTTIKVRKLVGYCGPLDRGCLYHTGVRPGRVPVTISLRSADCRVTVNGQVMQNEGKYCIVWCEPRMAVRIGANGSLLWQGSVPAEGEGMWLVQ
jgi:hypothetical protein